MPVGSETVIDMYPLDFEEFLWANGIEPPLTSILENCLSEEKPVPDALHHRMRQLLLQYAVVGGMPDAVNAFYQHASVGSCAANPARYCALIQR